MANYGPKPKPQGALRPGDIPPWDCSICGQRLPVESYYENKRNAYGYVKDCKTCWSDRARTYREKLGAEHWRWRKVLANFGLTQEDFEKMLAAQGGGCAVCSQVSEQWHVDHDHACCPQAGKSCGRCVRGILCNHCNLMLGHAKDDPQRLIAAARYLEASSVLVG